MSQPNIIWITLDSVRTDHTTLGGYHRDTTPNLSRIATSGQGQSVEACISHGVWTLSSTASILTGTYPSYHGIGVGRNEALPAGLRTVPELLSDVGYTTAVLSRNSNLSEGTALVRGFDRQKLLLGSNLHREVPPSVLLRYLWNIRSHSAGFTTDKSAHASSYLITEIAKRWLGEFEANPDPVFFYVHYNEPHKPYFPPLPYLDRFDAPGEQSGLEAGRDSLSIHQRAPTGQDVDLSESEWETLRTMYDGEIAYTDACVGRLFDAVQAADLGETIVVITADHGEHLGEYGPWFGHDSVHDEVIDVPLVVAGDGAQRFGDVEFCQHADVMQTLLNAVGAGHEQFQGVDLTETDREYAFTQAHKEGDQEPLRYSVRSPTHKYVTGGGGTMLYELPDESTDVSETQPERLETFQRVHSEWVAEIGEYETAGTDARYSEEMKTQLRDMGYITD